MCIVSQSFVSFSHQDHLGEQAQHSALNESSEVVNKLCEALEACLFHGVKKSRDASEVCVAAQPVTPAAVVGLLCRLPSSSNNVIFVSVRTCTKLPHFWPVVEGLAKVSEQAFGPTLFMVRQLPTVQTPYGLCRAWIRKILNENSLVSINRAIAPIVATASVDDANKIP